MGNSGNTTGAEHPSVENLVDYFGGRLAQHRETELELHLSWCDDCAVSASRVRVLSHLVSEWTAAGYRRAAAESRVLRALQRATDAPACAAWRQRLSRWADWAGRSEAALRVTLRQSGKDLQASVSGLKNLARPGALWPDFAPLGMTGALATRGAAEVTGVVVSESAHAPKVRVNASGAEDRIEIEIEGLPAGTAPLAMLVPEDKEGRLMLGELRPGKEPSRFSAVFEKVGAGRYMLVIEPQAAAEQPSRPEEAFG